MTLSVVIVNYNVKYFLEQCLISVKKAMLGLDGEVFVVDNASADGSCQMVRDRFPDILLIENKENFGFSFANNQALRTAKGEFVLVLNPDTVVEEETFRKCIDFMRKHPEAGALSVKMIDGKGKFLPESKRALPSPLVSFYKIFGLAWLFPRSKTFARYHLGHLSHNETHEIEILPGAFMFIRKEALQKAGLFDEAFFMYGEDIDLSYRIVKCGYKNYYLHETTIIHYKGESTKKGSINYVLLFYKAMMIFARKHFTQKNAFIYIALIYAAIYFRAGLSIIKRIAKRWMLPAVDALIIIAGLAVIIPLWETLRFNEANAYPEYLVKTLGSIFVAIWLVSIWLSGGYDKPKSPFAAAKGIALGSLVILVAYALLPENMRFSRAIILLTSAWSMLTVQSAHFIANLFRKNVSRGTHQLVRIVIIGSTSEVNRVNSIIKETSKRIEFVGSVSPTTQATQKDQIGSICQLHEIVRVNKVDEVIFCSADISSQEIIKLMLSLVPFGVDFKIAPPESTSIIGSNSIDTSGDLYTIDLNAITKPTNRRFKRFFDIVVAFTTIILAPILFAFSKSHRLMFSKSLLIISGKLTWVGYVKGSNHQGLPSIKKGVFSPTNQPLGLDSSLTERINIQYAKSYSVLKDMSIIWSILTNKKPIL